VKSKPVLFLLMIAIPLVLVSCGSSTAPTTYTIGGTISGLNGSGLVLQYNGANNLTVSSNGPFIFTNAIVSGTSYSVTILTQPTNPAQTCTVTSGGSGTANTDIVIVEIACANNTFTVGGTVTGLAGSGLVLQYNGANNLPVTANGSFTFPTAAQRGSNYNVTVLTQPTGPAQTCDVTNGVGTNINGNVTAIQVACYTTTVTYTIGGTVSGLSGTGLVLQDNSGDNLAISSNGVFTFPTRIASGANYSVTALSQPAGPSQNCVVAGGGGTATANVTGIQVTCTTVTFTIGGSIANLSGTGLVLQDNGGDNLPVSSGTASFAFATQVASGATYAVTVLTQPSGTPCSVTSGSGTVANSAVTSVAIDCSGSKFNISATVSGLPAGASVVLQDNGGDNLTISANGLTTNFNTPIASGSAYAVTVLTQPAGATCTAGANASGKVATANVNVAVSCGDPISSGNAHVCAITSAGGIDCWGANDFGQLGDGTTTDSTKPVQVVGLTSSVVSVAAGYDFTCALTSGGEVWCWGDNSSGQLGNGSYELSSVPVQVVDSTGNAPLGGIAAIAAGRDHTCAVTAGGAALCWGGNSEGQLGTGDDASSNVPVPAVGLSRGVASISAGSQFTCAATTTGSALCWGAGESGQLGNGSVEGSNTPAAVLNTAGNAPLTGVVTISAGVENTCALMTGGTVLCWGSNNAGQLGNAGAGSQSSLPLAMKDSTGQALNDAVAINAGLDDFCAVTSDGAAVCWGLNENRGLAAANQLSSADPSPTQWMSSGVAAIAVGYRQTCALTTGGAAVCWGFPSGRPTQ
jgi:alpha-tubulin suppressor-like RCC1 family protein